MSLHLPGRGGRCRLTGPLGLRLRACGCGVALQGAGVHGAQAARCWQPASHCAWSAPAAWVRPGGAACSTQAAPSRPAGWLPAARSPCRMQIWPPGRCSHMLGPPTPHSRGMAAHSAAPRLHSSSWLPAAHSRRPMQPGLWGPSNPRLALVEATPISQPALMWTPQSVERAMALPTVLVTPISSAPLALAYSSACAPQNCGPTSRILGRRWPES